MTFFAHSNPRSFYTKRLPVKMELLLEETLKELKQNLRVLQISTVKWIRANPEEEKNTLAAYLIHWNLNKFFLNKFLIAYYTGARQKNVFLNMWLVILWISIFELTFVLADSKLRATCCSMRKCSSLPLPGKTL